MRLTNVSRSQLPVDRAMHTPGGVGSRRTPPLWMKPGDVVEVEIDRIGLLRNGIADEG